MKKTLLIIMILFTLSIGLFAVKDKVKVPEQIKIISQSCTMNILFISAIDLSNNELIVLEFSYSYPGTTKISGIVRTGIIINPEEQKTVTGKDAPFKKD